MKLEKKKSHNHRFQFGTEEPPAQETGAASGCVLWQIFYFYFLFFSIPNLKIFLPSQTFFTPIKPFPHTNQSFLSITLSQGASFNTLHLSLTISTNTLHLLLKMSGVPPRGFGARSSADDKGKTKATGRARRSARRGVVMQISSKLILKYA